jgi:serine protease Do
MRDRACLLPLLALLVLPGLGRADEASRRAQLRALLDSVQAGIKRAQPSIACVYVSRSDSYRTARYWGDKAVGEPGQLGKFSASAAEARVPRGAPGRERILRAIRDHDLSRPDHVPESYGSGIVVDPSGLILTNAHVVRNATKVYVRLLGGKGSWADIHAADPRSDLAVLRLLDKIAGLEALKLGGGDSVAVGQFVLSLAGTYAPGFRGTNPTIGWGLVRALRRKAPGNTNEMERHKITLHHYGTLIQTDPHTTPGVSGGALLNLDGAVIGLTTVLVGVRSDGQGEFAIPLDTSTRRIIEVLKKGEEVEYGFLGVILEDPRLRGGRGVYLQQSVLGTPAARAGLRGQDRVVSIDGKPVREQDDLFLHVGIALAGRTIRVEVERLGARRVFSVQLAKFYVPGKVIASKRPPARAGLRVDHTSILSQRNPFPRWTRAMPEGVMIREVVPGSPADKARLQPDKIITEVDGQAVTSPAEYYRAMSKAGARVEITFLDSRNRPEKITLDNK